MKSFYLLLTDLDISIISGMISIIIGIIYNKKLQGIHYRLCIIYSSLKISFKHLKLLLIFITSDNFYGNAK